MRFFAMFAAAAMAAAPTAVSANEARVEVRGGIAWVSGATDETIGLAVGYDADVSENFFLGVEAVADTDFNISSPVLGVNARAGFRVGEQGKLFATAGYAYETEFELDDFVLGAGYQHNVGRALVSIQYQRYMDTEINRAMMGVGYRF